MLKPEVLARWRTFLPEETIQTLLEHRRVIRERREKAGWTRVPDFAYPMPRLPEAEEKPEVLAMAIDTEGWIDTEHRWATKPDRYKTRILYERPEIGCETDNLALTTKIANMMLTTIRPRPPRPPRALSVTYLTVAGSSRAVMATHLMQAHLIKWKPQAQQVLQRYRLNPIRRLT